MLKAKNFNILIQLSYDHRIGSIFSIRCQEHWFYLSERIKSKNSVNQLVRQNVQTGSEEFRKIRNRNIDRHTKTNRIKAKNRLRHFDMIKIMKHSLVMIYYIVLKPL